MFAFLIGSLNTAASRFFAFEIGRGELGDVERYFRSVFTTHLLVIPVLFIVLETIGLFLLKTKLNIPVERIAAAMWVFHFSVFSTCLSIIQIPMVAMVIAYEKMGIYAYLSIFEAILKVIVAVVISYSPYDKLISYAALLTLSPVVLTASFHIYCRKSFSAYRLTLSFDRCLFKELFGYTGWSFVGSFANIMKMQGVNILLNLFFGPLVNAARGIAVQVNGIVQQFCQNFTVALNPQITKSYSSNDLDAMYRLLKGGAKLSFFLVFFLSLPVLLETEFLLFLWLGVVPEYTVAFVRILLIDTLIGSFAYSMAASIQATGKIRLFQLVVGGLFLFNVPISYLVLKLGYSPVSTAVVSVGISCVAIFARLWVLKREIPALPAWAFIREVFGRCLLVAAFAVTLPLCVRIWGQSDLSTFFIAGFSCVLSVSIFIWLLGMDLEEKRYIKCRLKSKWGRGL